MIVLVRHALPDLDDGPPSGWGLGPQAVEEAVALAAALPVCGLVVTSPERKCVQTAAPIADRAGLEAVVDERVREVDRPPGRVPDHRARAMRYLFDGGEDFEPRPAVVARFAGAVTDALAQADGDVAVVDGGMALSLYVASVVRLDVVEFWRELTFPDAWRLDAATASVERVYDGGRPPPDG